MTTMTIPVSDSALSTPNVRRAPHKFLLEINGESLGSLLTHRRRERPPTAGFRFVNPKLRQFIGIRDHGPSDDD